MSFSHHRFPTFENPFPTSCENQGLTYIKIVSPTVCISLRLAIRQKFELLRPCKDASQNAFGALLGVSIGNDRKLIVADYNRYSFNVGLDYYDPNLASYGECLDANNIGVAYTSCLVEPSIWILGNPIKTVSNGFARPSNYNELTQEEQDEIDQAEADQQQAQKDSEPKNSHTINLKVAK